jgi:hypothetical protein
MEVEMIAMPRRRWFLVSRLLSPLALCGIFSATVWGQANTSLITGTVNDPAGLALPGVTVTATSPQLISPQVAVTDERGIYRLPLLTAGVYEVLFECPGFQTLKREDIEVRAGVTLTVSVNLSMAGVEESVTVTGESPLLDVKGSQKLETYTEEYVEAMPTARRFPDFYHMIAGVEDGQYDDVGVGSSSVMGGTSKENRVNLEGSRISSGEWGYPWTDVSVDIIQEVQVVTGGISAEFGGVTGGNFNIITKSGGNDFSGSAYYYFVNGALQQENVTQEMIDAGITEGTTLDTDWNGGFTLGGPIMRDRLWFFGSYDYKKKVENMINFPVPVDVKQHVEFGKITAQLTPKHRLDGYFNIRDLNEYPFQPQTILADDKAYRIQDHWNRNFSLMLNSLLSESVLFDARAQYAIGSRDQTHPNVGDDPFGTEYGYEDSVTRMVWGGWYRPIVHPGDTRDYQIAVNTSLYGSDILTGTHDFKFGVYYDVAEQLGQRDFRNGARVLQLANGVPDRVALYNSPVSDISFKRETAIYAQDQWVLNNKLTLNLGVRFENFNVKAPEGFSGGINFPRQVFPEEELVSMNTVSPRLGAAYDLTGDGKTVLKASFGRYYGLYSDNFAELRPYASGAQTWEWNDVSGDLVWQPGEEGRLISDSTTVTASSGVDPDLRAPYWNTVTVGVDREVTRDLRFSVTGVWRKQHDVMETLDRNRPFDEAYVPITLTNPLTSQPITIYALDPAYRGMVVDRWVTNPDSSLCSFCLDPYLSYKGLLFTFEKRMASNWQLYGSYTLSSAEGNLGTHHFSAQSDLFSNPNNMVNAVGNTSADRVHSLKVQGIYQAPYGISVSAMYQALTGAPVQRDRAVLGPLVQYTRADSPLMVVESNITVRGLPPGEMRHEFRNVVDVRVEKKIDVRKGRIGLVFDVRNLFNGSSDNYWDEVILGRPTYGIPGELVYPRTFRLAARYDF